MLNVLENYTRLFHVCFFVFSSFKSWADFSLEIVATSFFLVCSVLNFVRFFFARRLRVFLECFVFVWAAVAEVQRPSVGVQYVSVGAVMWISLVLLFLWSS